MKLSIAVLLITFFISSCIKEKSTYSTTIAVNSTNHYILITPFANGVISNKDSFSLDPNVSKNIYESYYRGIGSGVTYGYDIPYTDSIIVTFDNRYKMVHYNHILPTMLNTKHYLFLSKRNLYNDSSYNRVLLSETSSNKDWRFTYTFTEQDYLDAK
jgi:hypothetical protein